MELRFAIRITVTIILTEIILGSLVAIFVASHSAFDVTFFFLNSILVGVILYISAGVLVNCLFNGAETLVEVIPQCEFWMSVPGLITDCFRFLAHGSDNNNYVNI